MSISGIMIPKYPPYIWSQLQRGWCKRLGLAQKSGSLAGYKTTGLQRAKPLVWPKMHLHRSKLNYAKTPRHSIHLRFAKNVSAVRPKIQNQYKSLPSLVLVTVYVLVPVLCLSKTQRCYTGSLKKSEFSKLVFLYFDRSQQSIRDPRGPRHELQSWQVTYDRTEPQRSNEGFVPFFVHVILASLLYRFLYFSPLFSTCLYSVFSLYCIEH